MNHPGWATAGQLCKAPIRPYFMYMAPLQHSYRYDSEPMFNRFPIILNQNSGNADISLEVGKQKTGYILLKLSTFVLIVSKFEFYVILGFLSTQKHPCNGYLLVILLFVPNHTFNKFKLV